MLFLCMAYYLRKIKTTIVLPKIISRKVHPSACKAFVAASSAALSGIGGSFVSMAVVVASSAKTH